MKYLITIIFLIPGLFVSSQELIMQLYFEDALGNKDTLYVGFDENATDSVDVEFDEVNIINTPLDSVFDVRITNELNRRVSHLENGTFHLKKQIQKKRCDSGFEAISVDIKAKHYPITLKWNSLDLSTECTEGSVFTSIPSGGWWDVGSPSDLYRVVYIEENTKTFTANYEEDNINYNYAYISGDDTLSVYWHVFANSNFVTNRTSHLTEPNIKTFPNLVTDFLVIDLSDKDENINSITVFNIQGKRVFNLDNIETSHYQINTHTYESGLYSLIINTTHEDYYLKFIKQ